MSGKPTPINCNFCDFANKITKDCKKKSQEGRTGKNKHKKVLTNYGEYSNA